MTGAGGGAAEHAGVRSLGPAWYRARAELRHRLGSVLLLALLVALVVGGVMGVAIGDRRNATAYDRLIRAGGGPDLLVTPGQNDDASPG